jgi:hypothetical protein
MGRVLIFSLIAMANPTLLAVTTVMLLLPNPKRLMLGYLLGALMTSFTLGIVIVFSLQNSAAVSSAKHTLSPAVDVAMGGILIVFSIVLATGRHARRERTAKKEKRPPRWQQALSKGAPQMAFVTGALLTLPGFAYLTALSNVAKLNYGTTATVLLVLMVVVIQLTLIEVPLLGFALAPEWTAEAIEREKAWFAEHGHAIAVRGTAILGSLLIFRGVVAFFS